MLQAARTPNVSRGERTYGLELSFLLTKRTETVAVHINYDRYNVALHADRTPNGERPAKRGIDGNCDRTPNVSRGTRSHRGLYKGPVTTVVGSADTLVFALMSVPYGGKTPPASLDVVRHML